MPLYTPTIVRAVVFNQQNKLVLLYGFILVAVAQWCLRLKRAKNDDC